MDTYNNKGKSISIIQFVSAQYDAVTGSSKHFYPKKHDIVPYDTLKQQQFIYKILYVRILVHGNISFKNILEPFLE